jgi:hypothetical protein
MIPISQALPLHPDCVGRNGVALADSAEERTGAPRPATAAPGGGVRHRFLIFAPAFSYMNPTTELFYTALRRKHDTVFYGPGYVPMDQLDADARKIYEERGPFDAVFLHQYFLCDSVSEASSSVYFPFSVRKFSRAFPRFPLNLDNFPCPLFAVLLLLDPYALTDFHWKLITEFPGWIITWDSSCARVDGDFYNVADAIRSPSRIFHDLHEQYPQKLIPFHHIISDDEFSLSDWHARAYDIAVPGTGYVRRRQAITSLDAHKLYRAPKPFPLTMARYIYLGRPYRYKSGLRLIRHYYREQIRRSRISFAEGSGFDIPVRKFFEIPAYGSLLAAIPCNRASDMGLVDGETFIAVDENSIVDVAMEMLRNPDRALGIIVAAQAMIRRCHSQDARMEQFEMCFSAIQSGRYSGAEWRAGQFLLRNGADGGKHGRHGGELP